MLVPTSVFSSAYGSGRANVGLLTQPYSGPQNSRFSSDKASGFASAGQGAGLGSYSGTNNAAYGGGYVSPQVGGTNNAAYGSGYIGPQVDGTNNAAYASGQLNPQVGGNAAYASGQVNPQVGETSNAVYASGPVNPQVGGTSNAAYASGQVNPQVGGTNGANRGTGYSDSAAPYEAWDSGYAASFDAEGDEPVFSDVSDLEPVYSYSSRSRYQRARSVFAQTRYIPGEPVFPPVLMGKTTDEESGPTDVPAKGGI